MLAQRMTVQHINHVYTVSTTAAVLCITRKHNICCTLHYCKTE